MKRVSEYSTEANVIEAIFQKQRNNSIAMISFKKIKKQKLQQHQQKILY